MDPSSKEDLDEIKGKKLFVAGVSWSTTDDGFLNFFARFGEISEAMVMRERTGRSRGFGFVTFKDPLVAEKVMKELQNQNLTLDGRKLDIMEAIPKSEMMSSAKPLPKKLYIAGVSWNTTDDGLFNYFSRFGTVSSAQIQRDRATGRSRGFGFVTFEEVASAEKVLAEGTHSLDGRKLEIKSAVPRGLVGAYEEQQRFAASRPKKIFIAGITEGVTEADLTDHFSHYGRVTECYIQKDRTTQESRGFGFLSFESADSVDNVLKKPSQKIGDKCVVDIKIARPKDATARGAAVWSSAYSSGLTPGLASGLGGLSGLGLGGGLGGGLGVGGGLGGGLGTGLGGGLGGSLGGGLAGVGQLDRLAGGFGSRAGAGVRDYSHYQAPSYDQGYGAGYGLGSGASAPPSTSGPSGYPEGYGTLGMQGWGQQAVDEPRKAAYDSYSTPAGLGGGSSGYEAGGQYSYGAFQGRRAGTVRRGYHPYGR